MSGRRASCIHANEHASSIVACGAVTLARTMRSRRRACSAKNASTASWRLRIRDLHRDTGELLGQVVADPDEDCRFVASLALLDVVADQRVQFRLVGEAPLDEERASCLVARAVGDADD